MIPFRIILARQRRKVNPKTAGDAVFWTGSEPTPERRIGQAGSAFFSPVRAERFFEKSQK
jgi:hypothetical protein